MSRFRPSVLTPDPETRSTVLGWLEAALAAVDPLQATTRALAQAAPDEATVIAVGKAAPAMARGAATVIRVVSGICVTDHEEPVPPGMARLIGDHPVPGEASLRAGREVLAMASAVPPGTALIALVSGGGSALCEWPRPGVAPDYLARVHRRMVEGGAGIAEINLVRAHLSSVKGGGVARAAGRGIDTYVISDVAGADPALVASGPTVPARYAPEEARALLEAHGVPPGAEAWEAMRTRLPAPPPPRLTLVCDGRDAARGAAAAVEGHALIIEEWLHGPVEPAIHRFMARAGPGVTIAVGEPALRVSGEGRGGRCTHAALLAASMIGNGDVFVAFATDGVDGRSGAAGAIVDSGTISRGGDPEPALSGFDSAGYLERSGDLLFCSPTGTNVSDIWILWRQGAGVVE